jgi:hypothetical protein
MPPKAVDLKTLIGKRDNAIQALTELFEEFGAIYSVQPELERLENIIKTIETKYRNIKKQQEVIADKIVEDGMSEDDELLSANQRIGESLKDNYVKVAKEYAAYQKRLSQPSLATVTPDALGAMTSAVTKMAEVMQGSKPGASGLERLPVPAWDGSRRSYPTWKKEFNHWMKKYSQDKDEQLQRFRKAMPRGFWWTDQIKTCRSIHHAWEILDIEFADKRKMMDELLASINNLRTVKGDSKSFTRYATQITSYVNDMEDNECSVTSSSETPFFMSQLLSKLDPRDNAAFGRVMKRNSREENVPNLIQWLHEEAGLRSRGKPESERNEDRSQQRGSYNRRTDNHSSDVEVTNDGPCPFGCQTKHLLAACPHYQTSTVDQRWEIVKQNQRCRKCLRPHHTKDCKKTDGTTCDKCKKNHHRSLHNDKKAPVNPPLNPNAASFQTPNDTVNNNVDMDIPEEKQCQSSTGIGSSSKGQSPEFNREVSGGPCHARYRIKYKPSLQSRSKETSIKRTTNAPYHESCWG